MQSPISTFIALTLTLFFIIDALGNIPAYLHLINIYEPKKRLKVAIRELIFALMWMILFNYLGEFLLILLDIDMQTVQIAGGVMLFLIAIRLIFSNDDEKIHWGTQEPFLVPLATPIIASPSVLAVIMVFSQKESSHLLVLASIVSAWFLSSLVLLAAKPIHALIKDKGLDACQRLMGLIVALVAVQYVLEGLRGVIK